MPPKIYVASPLGFTPLATLDADFATPPKLQRRARPIDAILAEPRSITGARSSHGRSANITMWAPSLAAESTESSLEATA